MQVRVGTHMLLLKVKKFFLYIFSQILGFLKYWNHHKLVKFDTFLLSTSRASCKVLAHEHDIWPPPPPLVMSIHPQKDFFYYQCFYPHRSRDSVSSICGILYRTFFFGNKYFCHILVLKMYVKTNKKIVVT